MTQEPAAHLDRPSYPIEDDDLASLPGYLGTRRIDREAPPDLRVETSHPAQGAGVLHPGTIAQK
jgi:hypothetical protein